jgi:hypothetical protein
VRKIQIKIGSDTPNEESVTRMHRIDVGAFDDNTPLIGSFGNVYEETSMKHYGSAISSVTQYCQDRQRCVLPGHDPWESTRPVAFVTGEMSRECTDPRGRIYSMFSIVDPVELEQYPT